MSASEEINDDEPDGLAEEVLTKMLQSYRAKKSDELKVKPFRVFHDSTMEELVREKPRHPRQLESISRFGPKTIGAHGMGVLHVIDEWADMTWKDPLDPLEDTEEVSVFEDALGDSSWTKVLTQLYLSFSRCRPRVTSKRLVLRSGCSEETVRRVLVEMNEKGIIDRGGRGEGHMLDPGKKRVKDLIYALERIEGRGKKDGIRHFIEHLDVVKMVERDSALEDGILELLDGDPAGIHGYLEDPVEAAIWAEERLRGLLAGLLTDTAVKYPVKYRRVLSNGGRPDAAIRMTDGSLLCIDAKLPIGKFRRLEENPSEERKSFLGSLRYHINRLSEKLVDPDAGTAPVCILFIPSEEIHSKIFELDPGIGEFSLGKNVIMASPSSLPTYFSFFGMYGFESELGEHAWGALQKEFMVDELFTTNSIQRTPVSESQMKILSVFLESYGEEIQKKYQKLNLDATTIREQIAEELRSFEDLQENTRSSNWNWISRSELFEEAGLECSNSRFSQILGGMEDEGFIRRSYDRDADGVVSVSVTLREGALKCTECGSTGMVQGRTHFYCEVCGLQELLISDNPRSG